MGTLVSCSPLLLGHDYPHGVGEEIPLAQLLKGYQPSSLCSTPQRTGGPDPEAQQVGFSGVLATQRGPQSLTFESRRQRCPTG